MSFQQKIRAEITSKIIASMRDAQRWQKPWIPFTSLSRNLDGRPYRGINTLVLSIEMAVKGYSSDVWGTYKAIQQKGGQVRKGERATTVVYFSFGERENSNGETSTYAFLKAYSVFNIEQCDGLGGFTEKPMPVRDWNDFADAESVIAETGAVIKHKRGDQAFYIPSMDYIQMPEKDQFKTAYGYYGTMFHELTHWTGHKSRIDRTLSMAKREYAFEELIAELGAAFICSDVGFEYQNIDNHASYLNSWIKALENDHNYIFQAASAAQKAADFVLGKKKEAENVETN